MTKTALHKCNGADAKNFKLNHKLKWVSSAVITLHRHLDVYCIPVYLKKALL